MTFQGPGKVTQKWLKIWHCPRKKSHFRSHFWVTFPGPWKVIFESPKMSFLDLGSVAQSRFTKLEEWSIPSIANQQVKRIASFDLGWLKSSIRKREWGPEIYGSWSSMEDWGADLSPCNFATPHFPAERNSFISLYLCDCPLLPRTSRPMKWRTLSQRPT